MPPELGCCSVKVSHLELCRTAYRTVRDVQDVPCHVLL